MHAPVILKIPTGLMGGGGGRGFHHCNTIGGEVKGDLEFACHHLASPYHTLGFLSLLIPLIFISTTSNSVFCGFESNPFIPFDLVSH